ncbi:MAG TPA: preprotein translocase subunit YajC [Gallionellaceae bacterium]|nr:preprotein translocase subunit YajC [Gallionellaceae bacterium]
MNMMSISNLLISNAYADGAAPQQAGPSSFFDGQIIFLIAMLAFFYFMVMRPQQKRAKEMAVMLAALQKGDEVATMGGVLGRVTKVGESYISLEVADGVELNVQKAAIQTVLPKGTIKGI